MRCFGDGDPLYERYHDEEWGRPVVEDRALFERLSLEGFQAGLSWITVLRKRPALRAAFADFEPAAIASFGEDDVARLLEDASIIRNRAKIEATISNARALIELHAQGHELSTLLWAHAARRAAPRRLADLPGSTEVSLTLSKQLKRAGFRFVGPTTVYASMQACGIVNDHLARCPVRREVEAERSEALASMRGRL